MPHPLDGCRAKIEWTNQRIKDFEPILKAFGDANTYKMRSEYNSETGRLLLVFTDCMPLPIDLSILTGEALYQLRSALDHLFWQLVIANRRTPNTSHAFPIYWESEKYKARIKSIEQDVSASAAKRIGSYQPFKRGTAFESDPLWVLQELNNIDKHRFLLVARSFIGWSDVEFELKPPIHLRKGAKGLMAVRAPVEDGVVFAWWETDQRKVNIEGKVSVIPVLKEVGSAKNQPVIPLLTQLSGYVSGIVESFAPEFG
jgi:hypothetical protein